MDTPPGGLYNYYLLGTKTVYCEVSGNGVEWSDGPHSVKMLQILQMGDKTPISQTIMTHFIMILPLLLWSGTNLQYVQGDTSLKMLLRGISDIFLPMFSSRTFMLS